MSYTILCKIDIITLSHMVLLTAKNTSSFPFAQFPAYFRLINQGNRRVRGGPSPYTVRTTVKPTQTIDYVVRQALQAALARFVADLRHEHFAIAQWFRGAFVA